MPNRLSKSKTNPDFKIHRNVRFVKTSRPNLTSQPRSQGWLNWFYKLFNWPSFLSKPEKTTENIQLPVKSKSGVESKKIVFHQSKRIRQTVEANQKVKVFAPNSTRINSSQAYLNSQANIKTLSESLLSFKSNWFFNWQESVLSLKTKWSQTRLFQRAHETVVRLLIISSVGFIIYLTFFDTYFLVNKYEIVFAKNSYLDSQNLQKIITNFQQQKFLGVLPNNQFWFINERSLYNLARQINPEVTQVKILARTWPNQVKLEITTKPILVTLGLNNGQEYWRVGQTGRIVSKDEANLRENLVVVEYPVVLTVGSQVATPQEISFANYSFEQRPNQLNRFWYIIWLWNELDKLQVQVISTAIPSLSDFDSNVIITTSNNTKLYFDVNTGDAINQARRLKFIFESSTLADKEARGELAYIDFRFPKRVFVCNKNSKCDPQ